MNEQSQMLLRDSNIKPTDNLIADCLGETLRLPISADTKEYINNIKPNGNKMKFLSVIFDVDNDKQFNDILLLSQFRKENINDNLNLKRRDLYGENSMDFFIQAQEKCERGRVCRKHEKAT